MCKTLEFMRKLRYILALTFYYDIVYEKTYSISFHQKFESDQFDVEIRKSAVIKQNFQLKSSWRNKFGFFLSPLLL